VAGQSNIRDAVTWLYRQYDADDTLLYVGISKKHKRRGYQHACTAKWAEYISRTSWVEYPNRDAALAAEERAIAFERPIYNIRRPFRPLGLDPSAVCCPLLLELFFQKGEIGGVTPKPRPRRYKQMCELPPIDWDDMVACWLGTEIIYDDEQPSS